MPVLKAAWRIESQVYTEPCQFSEQRGASEFCYQLDNKRRTLPNSVVKIYFAGVVRRLCCTL